MKMLVMVIFALAIILVTAQDNYVLLHKNLNPIQSLIDDAKNMESQNKESTAIIFTYSPVVLVSVNGPDLRLGSLGEEEKTFKSIQPGFFRGRYKAKDYNHALFQKIQGYTIVHFINDALYDSYVQEIKDKNYYILSQLFVTVLKEKTIYGVIADFQKSE